MRSDVRLRPSAPARCLRGLRWPFVLAAFAALLGWVGTGPLLRRSLERQLRAAAGPDASVQRVEPAFLAGEVRVRGVRVPNPPGYTPAAALTIAEARMDAAPQAFLAQRIAAERLVIPRLRVRLESQDGQGNLAALRAGLRNAAARSPEDLGRRGPRYRIGQVRVRVIDVHIPPADEEGPPVEVRRLPGPRFAARDRWQRLDELLAQVVAEVAGALRGPEGLGDSPAPSAAPPSPASLARDAAFERPVRRTPHARTPSRSPAGASSGGRASGEPATARGRPAPADSARDLRPVPDHAVAARSAGEPKPGGFRDASRSAPADGPGVRPPEAEEDGPTAAASRREPAGATGGPGRSARPAESAP